MVLIEVVVTAGDQVLRAAAPLEEAGAEVPGILAVLGRRDRDSADLGGYTFAALLRLEDLGVTGGD